MADNPYGGGSWKTVNAEDALHGQYEQELSTQNAQGSDFGMYYPDAWTGMDAYLKSKGVASGSPADYYSQQGAQSWDPAHPIAYQDANGQWQINQFDIPQGNWIMDGLKVPAIFAAMIASAGAASGAFGAGAGALEGGLTSAAGTGLEAAEAGFAGSGAGGFGGALGGAGGSGLTEAEMNMLIQQAQQEIATGAAGSGTGTAAGGSASAMNQLQSLMQNLPNLPPGTQQLVQQMLSQGSTSANGVPGASGSSGLASLLPFLGIGSGLNTMFNNKPAVDPAMIASLFGAGQQTYQTSLDPQRALYDRTAQQVQDQTRASQAARGIAMGPYGAGVENKAMSDFNIDWQNQQLQRQVAGTQAFAGAGNTAANAGIANAGQQFAQNQTGLNNLTTGAGQLFGTGGGTPGASGGQNPIGSWLSNLFTGGSGGGTGAYSPFNSGSSYNSQGTYQPFYTGYDSGGGAAYG